MSTQRIVLFDFDGPINDTFAIALAATRRQNPSLDAETYRSYFRGNIFSHPTTGTGLTPGRPPAESDPFFVAYVPPMLAQPPVLGVPEAIAELASSHPMLIVSSTVSAPIERYLDAYGLRAYFDAVWGGDVERSKSVKIANALMRYGVGPDDCVFVTDTVGDVLEARHVGVRSVAVSWGYHPRTMLEEASPAELIDRPTLLAPAVRGLFL